MNIYEFIKNNEFSTIVEIGCHFGTDTKKFKEMLPNCEIICFEPDPRNINILKKHSIDKIAKINEFAVSNVDGEFEFYLSSGKYNGQDDELKNNDWSASNSLKKPKEHLKIYDWVKFEEKIFVKTIKLDSCLDLKNKKIDFMWIDVQGAEDLVFIGATETLKNTNYIYTEYSNSELYDNQPSLTTIQNILSTDWEIMYVFENDVLFKNKNFKK